MPPALWFRNAESCRAALLVLFYPKLSCGRSWRTQTGFVDHRESLHGLMTLVWTSKVSRLFWLRQQSTCKLPKKSGSRCTKDAFLLSLRNNPAGDHEWESSVKGLCCLRCGTKLPKYKSLSDLEVLVQIPCDGMSGVRGVHYTHTMYGGTRKTCNVCKGVCYAGRQISKKLRQPCGTSGRVLYIQTEIVWAGSLLGENKYHSPAKVYSCQKSVCVFRHSCSCCCAVGCIPLEACLIDLSALTIE